MARSRIYAASTARNSRSDPDFGSGMMQPLVMNELIQADLQQVGFKIILEIAEIGILLTNWRQGASHPSGRNAEARRT